MNKEELKKRRERLGFSQSQLADALGFASNTISGYETGRMEIPKYMDLVLESLENRKIKELQNQSEVS